MDIELKLKDKCDVLYLAMLGLNDPSVKYYKVSLKVEPVFDEVIDHSASTISVPPFPGIYLCTQDSCSHDCFLNQLDLDNHIAVDHISKRVKRKSNAKDDPTNDAFVTAISESREDPQSKIGVGARAISLDVDSGTGNEILSSSNSNTATTTSSSSSNAALPVPVPTETDNIGGPISSKNLAETNHPFVKPQEKPQKNLTWTVDCTCNACFDNIKDFILHIDLDHEIQRGLHFDFLPFPTCKMCPMSKQPRPDFEDNPTSFGKHLWTCNKRIKERKTLFKPKSYPSLPEGSNNVEFSNKWYGQFTVDATQMSSSTRESSCSYTNRRTTRSASVARKINTSQKTAHNLAARPVGPAGPGPGPETVVSSGNTNIVQPEGKQTTRVSSPSPERQVYTGRSRREDFDRHQKTHQGIKSLQGCQPLRNRYANRQQPKRAFAFRSPSRTESQTRKKAKTGQHFVGDRDRIAQPEIQQVEALSQNCIKHSESSSVKTLNLISGPLVNGVLSSISNRILTKEIREFGDNRNAERAHSFPEQLEPDLTLIQLEGKEVHIHTPSIDQGSSFGSFGVTHATYRQLSSTPIWKPTRDKK